MLDEAILAASECGSVVAPAGCGKTELIARTIQQQVASRSLVLTHTHAGVRALRDRFARLNVGRDKAHVDTIAGWCLRYVRSYPKTSGITNFEPTGEQWEDIYHGTNRLLLSRAVQDVVRTSFPGGIYVDEYQDCTPSQHRLIVKLSQLLPTRVLGDPLQGIFAFAGGCLSWPGDVETAFPRLGELSIPYRWKGKNEELGAWLLSIRAALQAGIPIDLSSAPLKWQESTPDNQRAIAYGMARMGGQVVVIKKWKEAAHKFARSVGGIYQSMEEIDCSDLYSFAKDLDRMKGFDLALRIVDFCSTCMTGVRTALGSIPKALNNGTLPNSSRLTKAKETAEALVHVVQVGGVADIQAALRSIELLPDVNIFRRELWREALRSLRAFEAGHQPSYFQAAWSVRNRVRFSGRKSFSKMVSRTLLVKGLEFDHSLILDADEFSDTNLPGDAAKHFYVAMTRGAQSLAVLSKGTSVRFQPAAG